MSENSFLKLDTSRRTDLEILIKNYPLAFSLLSLIAIRACRTLKHPLGLKPGEALIGDWQGTGFSRQNYRTALKYLVQHNYIEIIESRCSRQQVTTQPAIKGTKVRLLNSMIYDINIKYDNHSTNQSNNHWPTTNEERKEVSFVKKENVEKKSSVVSVSFSSIKDQETIQILEMYCQDHKLQISSNSLERWLKKYGEEILTDQLGYLAKKKTTIRKHEAWMETSLQQIQNFNSNYEWINNFATSDNANSVNYLTITKNYCRDEETGNDYQYSIPHNQFVEMILNKHQQKKEVGSLPS